MTDKKSSESRRKLLKSIAAGSGAIVAGKSLPESWNRPIVDSVVLPAHAETSPPALVDSSGPAGNPTSTKLDNGSLFADAADVLIPEAKAGVATLINSQVCVSQITETTGTFEAWVVYEDECETWTVHYSASNVTLGVPATMAVDFPCRDGVDATDVLNKLGLVNDAIAADDHLVTIETFAGSRGGAKGQFEDYDAPTIYPFDLETGNCSGFDIICEIDDKCE